MATNRPDRTTHFVNRAKTVAERSTCLRRRVGAVIIKDGTELSSGYVGAPRDAKHCYEIGECLRRALNIPSGERYELCRNVHAEQNAIINAARIGISIFGSDIYISSERLKGAYPEGRENEGRVYAPCNMCIKELINAGINKVYMREEDDTKIRSYDREQLSKIILEEEKILRIKYKEGQSI
jgi:dCMP deaminase